MSHIGKLRIVLPLAIAAVAAVGSPSARAGTVCNEAGNGHHDGTYVATDSDPNPPARYKEGLSKLGNGVGTGHDRAAAESPALSQCGKPAIDDGDDDGGGGVIEG
jgi:hypothetical protein